MQDKSLRVLEFHKIREEAALLCASEPGQARMRALMPVNDISEIKKRQAETEEASVITRYTGAAPVPAFEDVSEYVKRAAVGATLSAKALLACAESLRAARSLRGSLVTDREDTPYLTARASSLLTDRPLEEEIFDAILSEDEISDHASPELADIRRHIRQCNERVKEKLNAFVHSPTTSKYLQDAIVTMRNGRYVLPVKAEARQFVPGLVHDQSATGATLFIEPMSVVETGNDLKQWLSKEQQEIERILRALTMKLSPISDGVQNNLDIMADIDMIFARASWGASHRCCEVKIREDRKIKIIEGRHPLIDPNRVVPISLEMGGDVRQLIVTGPNTGGKTVTLKTVGLFALLMQAGFQLPAKYGTEMPVFDEVFADIGDEQSIEQSLSTFSSHMVNIVSILKSVTPLSLALFDELGAGTDPTEGAALAISILERLRAFSCDTLATTHYAELKAYALSTQGVENAAVEFDIETLRPTYRLLVGVPGKSNAFEISKKLGLPADIIRDAGARLSHEQVHFEDVIANAEYHRKVAEKERQLAEQAHAETAKAYREAEALQKKMEEQRESYIKKAKEDARRLLIRAQRESEEIISQLKKAKNNDGVTLREHELNALRGRMQGTLDEMTDALASPISQEPPKDLKIGETVQIATSGVRGTVVSLPDAKGEATVQAGVMKWKVHVSQLRRAQGQEPEKKKRSSGGSVTLAPRAASMEVDVRGMSLSEAIEEVDRYIDSCILNSQNTVQIIHGKGSGILRSGIQEHLRKHPSVAEYRLGKYGEGEDGVTVVTLK